MFQIFGNLDISMWPHPIAQKSIAYNVEPRGIRRNAWVGAELTLGRGSFPSPGLRAGGGTLPVQWGMAEWGTRAEWWVPPWWRMVHYSQHDGGAPLAPVAGAPVLSCQLPSSLPIPSIIVSGGLICLIPWSTHSIDLCLYIWVIWLYIMFVFTCISVKHIHEIGDSVRK